MWDPVSGGTVPDGTLWRNPVMKKEKLFWAVLFTVCIPALLAVNLFLFQLNISFLPLFLWHRNHAKSPALINRAFLFCWPEKLGQWPVHFWACQPACFSVRYWAEFWAQYRFVPVNPVHLPPVPYQPPQEWHFRCTASSGLENFTVAKLVI